MNHVSIRPAEQQASQRTVDLLERIFPSPRSFAIRLWDGTELPGSTPPAFTLVLNHPGSLRRMFATPIERNMGEAYIYGDFEVEGDLLEAVSLLDSLFENTAFTPGELAGLLQSLRSLPAGAPRGQAVHRPPAELKGEVHSLERDRRAIQYHYDVGNDFYTRWLDPAMQYSCAYFPTGTETLEEAQQKKMEHICRKLRLQAGDRLLDIGCGWGGLARYAAQHFGVQVTGVTLSEQQARYAQEENARQGLQDQVKIELRDYRTLGDMVFDKIVSVGMFEHVGRSHLPEYFKHAYRMLVPGGLFLNHGISRKATLLDFPAWSGLRRSDFNGHQPETSRFVEQKVLGRDTFSQKYVFPDGELVPVSAATLLAELAGFEVRDVENLREHYALTARQWVRRLGEREAELIDMVGADVYRTWRLFLSVSARSFEAARIGLHQSLLAKPDHGRAYLPMSRADLYR